MACRFFAMKLAIISGTSINRSEVFGNWERFEVETEYGVVEMRRSGGIVLVHRHGFEQNLPPHVSNYKGCFRALQQLGVDTVLTVSSVGSLKADLLPGTLVSCSDYVSFAPMTFMDKEMQGFVPEVDNGLIDEISKVAGVSIERGKVYHQTHGPRFETPAEVRILRMMESDVVGMTFANEADLALESGIKLNSLCMVDNLANGIESDLLTVGQFHDNVQGNQGVLDQVFSAVVARFGD